MPAARFWRIDISAVTNGSRCSLSELAFLSSAFEDLSVGGTAYASNWDAARPPANAFDKANNTYWQSTSVPAGIWYDHVVAVDVQAVRLRTSGSGNDVPLNANAISLSWSDEGELWSSPIRLRLETGTLAENSVVDLMPWDGVIGSTNLLGSTPFATAPTPPPTIATEPIGNLLAWRDMEFSGRGFIAGTVKRDADPTDVPLRRRVRLHREVDGLVVRETWSEATTGAYLFDGINESYHYTVITYDHLHDYRAVIADNITPELLP